MLAVSGADAGAQPAFDVAYRAWEVVGEISRYNRDPVIAGECGRTFQASVVPALRRQTRDEQAASALACVQQARALCSSRTVARGPASAKKCEEFR